MTIVLSKKMKQCPVCLKSKREITFFKNQNVCRLCLRSKGKIDSRVRAQLKSLEKNYIQYMVRRAVKRGDLTKTPCVRCGNEKSCGHHPDYSKPLEVIWLCAKCHYLEHHGV